MRFILTTLIAIFLAFTAAAQSPIFEFECFSNANMTGDSCDICVGTSFQSRSFNGLMVYRLGVFNRWIDEPYLIRLRPGNSVEFIEQIGTNPDRITIPLNQTGFSTISGFIDSTFCAGANVDFSFFASDSLRTTAINYLDTIKIVGRGGTTVFFDTLTQKYIITSPASSGGTNLSFTGSSSPVTLNSSTGTDVNFAAGASISLAGTSTNLTITNTAPNINQTISYSAPTVTLSNGGGSFNIPQGDITGSGAANQMSYFTGTKTIASSSRFAISNSTSPSFEVSGGDGAGGGGGVFLLRKDGSNNLLWGADASIFGGTGYGNTLFQYGNNPLAFATNGVKRLNILGDGSVGIGTALPVRTLHVDGTARITGSSGTAITVLGRNAAGDISDAVGGIGGFGDITGAGANTQVTFFTGTKTIAGSSRFTVNNASLAGLIMNGGNGSGGDGSYIQFQKDGTNNFIFGAESSLFGGTGTGGAIFQYGDNPFFFCTNSSKRAVLLGNGNFGIGTLTPAQLLHVAGIARITGSGSTATTITGRDANNDITNVGIGTNLSISGGTLNATAPTNAWIYDGNTIGSNKRIGSNDAFAVAIETNNTDRMYFDNAGKIGIGNTAPVVSMDFDGTTDGIVVPSGSTAQRPTILGNLVARNLRYLGAFGLEVSDNSNRYHLLSSGTTPSYVMGAAAGTGGGAAAGTGGNELSSLVTITVGTAPTAGGVIFARTFASVMTHAPTVVFSAGNSLTASEITKFYALATTSGYTLYSNATLQVGANNYVLNIQVRN